MAAATVRGRKKGPARKPAPPALPDHRKAVEAAVLTAVGRPDDLVRLEVCRTHDHKHFRVNMLREVRRVLTRADSWYVSTDDAGNITEASPPLARRFYDDMLRSYV